MSELACHHCRELDAELALGVVTGRERAQAVAHLNRCEPCQDVVESLAQTTDRLVELLPDAEPPATLEQRVVATLLAPPARAPRSRHTAVAVVLLVLVVGTAGGLEADSPRLPADPGVATLLYAPLLDGDHKVGEVYLHPGNPGWLHLSLDGATLPSESPITCNVVRSDATRRAIGAFTPTPGQDEWSAAVPADARAVAGATLTDLGGHTLGAARFGQSVPTARQRTDRTSTVHRAALPTPVARTAGDARTPQPEDPAPPPRSTSRGDRMRVRPMPQNHHPGQTSADATRTRGPRPDALDNREHGEVARPERGYDRSADAARYRTARAGSAVAGGAGSSGRRIVSAGPSAVSATNTLTGRIPTARATWGVTGRPTARSVAPSRADDGRHRDRQVVDPGAGRAPAVGGR